MGIKIVDTKEDYLKRGEEWEHNPEHIYVGEWEVRRVKPIQLTLEEVYKQFEEDTFNVSLDFTKSDEGDYLDYTTFERFNGWYRATIANNMFKKQKNSSKITKKI